MSMDLKRQEFSTEPKYFIAGTRIGITSATKEAAADIEAHAPVLLADGKISPIAKVDGSHALSLTGLYGIAADGAASGSRDFPDWRVLWRCAGAAGGREGC